MTESAHPPDADHSRWSRRFAGHLAAGCVVLLASIWLSSGTLSPHVLTSAPPVPYPPCGYLYSLDHPHHLATMKFLSGAPRAEWEWGAFLRRILFPALALPFMRWFGFESGGFIASLLLHVAALIVFAAYLRKRFGDSAAIGAIWLLATYPGIPYWGALPYCYSAIVPCTLLIFVLLSELEGEGRARRALLLCGLLGLLFTAYDFLPIFGLAALIVLVVRRRLRWLAPACVLLIGPTAAWNLALWRIIRLPALNVNTGSFRDIILAWLHPKDLGEWGRLLADVPRIAVDNFLDSGFWILPLLFVVLLVLDRVGPRLGLTLAEKAIGAAVLLLFLFNNAAPPYEGWQLRGDWVARFYQPVFVIYLSFAARMIAKAPAPVLRTAATVALVAAVIANASVAFGAVLRVPWAGTLYYRFYRHSPRPTFERNLVQYGRRPLGFCKS